MIDKIVKKSRHLSGFFWLGYLIDIDAKVFVSRCSRLI